MEKLWLSAHMLKHDLLAAELYVKHRRQLACSTVPEERGWAARDACRLTCRQACTTAYCAPDIW
jgi:hypothetical protein